MVPLRPVIEHEPFRPDWICSAGCGPWPCAAQRERWLELYDGAYRPFGAMLGALYAQMSADLDVPGEVVYARLLGWVPWRRRRPTGVLSR